MSDDPKTPLSTFRAPRSRQKILIVDDKEANLIALEKVLRQVDAEVIKARSGDDALKAVLNHDFALLILDVQMPGMDGYELASHLRGDDTTKVIPIVFVTAALADEQHMFKGYEAGGMDYIVKPYAPKILVGKVKVFLEMDHYRRELQMHRDHLEALVAERTAELKERERYFRSLMRNMHENIVVIDKDYVITDCNNPFSRRVGKMRDEIIGKHCYEVPHGYTEPCAADDEQCPLREVFETGEPRNVQHVHTHADASKVYVDILLSPMKDESGRVTHIVEAIRDISKRKRAEEHRLVMEAQLRQSQKLESIGTLAGVVAHEINNPINGIMNYAQLILDKLGSDSPVSEYATEIGKETERVAMIVRNLLSFARHEEQADSKARMCDIVETTLSLIQTIIRHDQITLEVNVPEDLPSIRGRSQQIQQVFMNLLTNARDALNGKYEGFDEDKRLVISSHILNKNCQQWVRTTVEDQGPGIPEEVQDRMFDPFYTTKPRDKGTGLGLSISHGIVKDHGGELSVETKVGEWTRFHVDLPVGGSDA
ncbi:MAG: response regulator [Kiritimatiellia bacterium]|nr:response regulator [Kiritimatiellia bacterium]